MRELLFKLFGLVLIVGSLVGGWQWMHYQTFLQTPIAVGEAARPWMIAPGESLQGVARQLEQQGVIGNRQLFVWMARLKGKATTIQAGEYRLEPGTRPEALLEQFTRGMVFQHGLTLVEGWNFVQVMAAVRAMPALKQTLASHDAATVMAAIGHPDEHPEGRFLPDTYHFPRGTSDVEFLRRAYRAMQQLLAEGWPERDADLPLSNPYEALILASIVEKETGVAEERPEIAGVFVRRLRKRMRLQTDPTVIYGIGPDFDGNIRRSDLQRDTPYNTYTRSGLPPTPIAMPGRAAIDAVLHPAVGNSLYFVAMGEGRHYFSDDLAEHNAAVIKYQLKGRRRPFSSSK